MAKHLILIHGRSIKPARAEMAKLARKAIAEGLRRGGAQQAASELEDGTIKYDFVYYGDVNNRIQAEHDRHDREALKATDPENGKPCLPIEPLEAAYAMTAGIPSFTQARYKDVLREADDYRFLDEAADFASLLGAVATFGLLNTAMIRLATPDMAEYLRSHTTGSLIRQRLHAVLGQALEGDDDICLVAHSMGTMVAYDQLWKYTHTSEYAGLRDKNPTVNLLLTIGCPLGEPGVRVGLRDGLLPEDEKYPRNIIRQFWNFYAEDDFVAHIEKMRVSLGQMLTKHYLDDIRDRHIYNCWCYRDNNTDRLVSNPHDLYGYLMNHKVGARIGEWAAAPPP